MQKHSPEIPLNLCKHWLLGCFCQSYRNNCWAYEKKICRIFYS